MSWHKQLGLLVTALALLSFPRPGRCQSYINEVLFAPPGQDAPNQYLELRGRPNYFLPGGACLLAVNGNGSANPGTIENVFDLSGRNFGGNGFLLLLQKSNSYSVSASATVLANAGSGPGFGSGASSSIGHRGRAGRTDLPHAAVTFLLVLTTNTPSPGTDIDSNNDGIPDGVATNWVVLDAVGIADAPGDFGYGLLNFRHSGGTASGTLVPVNFTPGYFGRTGNTSDSAAASWAASGTLGGSAPNWTLSALRTVPAEFSGLPLNHLGLPNFGASPLPGIVALQAAGGIAVTEGGVAGEYFLGLNTAPSGTVVLQINPAPPMEVSVDGGATFYSAAALNLSDTSMRRVKVRALLDHAIELSPHSALIQHPVLLTDDPVHYPTTSLTPQVAVNISEAESLLLNELKVNPPGSTDAPCEYIELRGPPNALLRDVYLLAIDGDASRDPGQIKLALDLRGTTLGSNGLLFAGAPGNPYTVPGGTSVLLAPSLSRPEGGLPNNAVSYLLLASPEAFVEGSDLDAGDNGVLEGLPAQTRILDAVGWPGAHTNDIVYGGVRLSGNGTPPDALGRFSTNNTPQTAQAWYFGELTASNCDVLLFDSSQVSSNFPFGLTLSPGAENTVPVQFSSLGALSGVTGDPLNPGVVFYVSSGNQSADSIDVTAVSSNPGVVPDTNLTVVAGPNGRRTLFLNPVGVGYATIMLSANANAGIGQIAFPYAASAMGRPGGVWHTFASDASTALAVGPDYMLVGDNENNVLRLYQRNFSGAPIMEVDLQLALGLTPDEHGEVNIEASTRVGNRLFFIGAHSNSNLGVTRTNRNRIFAVDVSGSGTNAIITYVGRYDFLKPDLINWDSTNGHGKGSNYYGFAASAADTVNPKAPDGFNIEGLAMAPGSTNIGWIGFRAPIAPATNRTFALIVPVLNFASLAVSGGAQGSALFGAPIELDLYGRGIRSIEGGTSGYLISGGPAGDVRGYPDDFRLYTWTGNPADQPQQRAAELAGLQPEGIVELPAVPWDAGTQVQVVTDNGTTVLYNDGIENKHLQVPAFKKFRSDRVALGPVVVPMPVITSLQLNPANVTVGWRSLQGFAYRVQRTESLSSPGWTDASSQIVAAGPFATAMVSKAASQAYYRIVVVSSP